MFIIRLISFLILLAGLVAVAAGGWLLLGNKLTIPESALFGAPTELVEQTLPPAEPVAGARSFPEIVSEAAEAIEAPENPLSLGKVSPPSISSKSEGFQVQMMPNARGFGAPAADPLDAMKEVPIAYSAPEKAQFARSFEVTVAIDGTGSGSAVDALPSGTRQIEDTALVTEKVSVSISGSSFDIESLSQDPQILSDQAKNVWRWKVTPRAVGNQELAVDIYGFKDDAAVPIRTYSGQVNIEVSAVGQVIALAEQANPVAVFLGGVGSVLAGFFGFIRLFRS